MSEVSSHRNTLRLMQKDQVLKDQVLETCVTLPTGFHFIGQESRPACLSPVHHSSGLQELKCRNDPYQFILISHCCSAGVDLTSAAGSVTQTVS